MSQVGNVWVCEQLIHIPTRTGNQLYKNPNIALLDSVSDLIFKYVHVPRCTKGAHQI